VKLPQIEPKIALEKSKIASATLRQWLREKERDYLAQKLADLGGNVGLTAKMCRIGVRTLSRKMRLYGLDKNRFKDVIVSNEPLGPNGDRSVSGLSNDGD
jgi:DNA-binding NtrC family response regulator